MKYFTAIDVGGTSIKYALINELGKVSNQGKINLPINIDAFYQAIEKIYQMMNDIEETMGIALSMPGAVDSETGFIGGASAVPYIHGPNIKKDLEKRIKKPVQLENDANCAALAEVWLGSASDVQDCMFIVSGTGIGGAVVKDKKIHKGKHLHGGEFGYMIATNNIDDEMFSTWSWDGSTVAVVRGVAKELQVPVESLNGKDIFDQASSNPIYQKYVNRFYYVLAMGIFNLQYVFDPEKIVIGGGVSSRKDLLEQVTQRLDIIFTKFNHAKIRPIVVKCQFENEANLIGAVYHFINC